MAGASESKQNAEPQPFTVALIWYVASVATPPSLPSLISLLRRYKTCDGVGVGNHSCRVGNGVKFPLSHLVSLWMSQIDKVKTVMAKRHLSP